MIYLDLDDLLHIASRTLDGNVVVRDYGLLQSALARPKTTVGGRDAYSSLDLKAAGLVQSVVNNHGLVDGNKRLGLAALFTFSQLNGRRLDLSNDEAFDLIIQIADGTLANIDQIASRIRTREP